MEINNNWKLYYKKYLNEFTYKATWYDKTLKLDENSLEIFKKKCNSYFSPYYEVHDIKDGNAFLKKEYISSIDVKLGIKRSKILIIDSPINLDKILKKMENLIDNIHLKKITILNDFENISKMDIDAFNSLNFFIIPMKIICEFFCYRPPKYISCTHPTRFIDVITKERVNGMDVSYCCWSYCWSIYDKIDKDEVFDIMCKYTSKIGFRYMWVDKYCIDQNNDNDKAKEIPKMRDYYMKAQVTIVWLHDIENIDSDMSVSEWTERLWTLQEWELSRDKWILVKNGEYINYQSEKKRILLPKSRLDKLLVNSPLPSTNKPKLYDWLMLSEKLKCSYEVDKILGILGMLPYSRFINLENINIESIKEVLYNILIIDNSLGENKFPISILNIKDKQNENFIHNMKKLKFLMANYFDSIQVLHEIKPTITYKGLNTLINIMNIENFNIKKVNNIEYIKNYKINHIDNEKLLNIIKNINNDIYINEIKKVLLFTYKPINEIIDNNNIYIRIKKHEISFLYNLYNSKGCDLDLVLTKISDDIFEVAGFWVGHLEFDNIIKAYINLKNNIL